MPVSFVLDRDLSPINPKKTIEIINSRALCIYSGAWNTGARVGYSHKYKTKNCNTVNCNMAK